MPALPRTKSSLAEDCQPGRTLALSLSCVTQPFWRRKRRFGFLGDANLGLMLRSEASIQNGNGRRQCRGTEHGKDGATEAVC